MPRAPLLVRTLIAGLLFAAVPFAIADAPAALAQDHDFRNARWGMTADEVRAAEANRFVEWHSDNPKSQMSLVYECSIGGLPCRLVYEFNNEGRLYGSHYDFTDVPFDEIYEFDTALRATLDEKYPGARTDRGTDFWRTARTDIELGVENGHPSVQYTARDVPAVVDDKNKRLPTDQF